MGGERILSEPELNRALLARQLLLERKRLSLPKALERIGGIQAQYAPSMYIGLWSRVEGFERDQLTRALERRKVAQGTSLRATIHLLTPADWWAFTIAIRERRRETWLGYHRDGPSAEQMVAAARRVRKRLAEGPVDRKELAGMIGFGPQGVTGITLWLDLVRVPPSGTWERRRADRFGDAAAWLGAPPDLSRGEATVALVRSYLRGFGPATLHEIADWGGLSIEATRLAIGKLELRSFRSEDGAELVDLPRMPLPDPETPAPPRFLPTWDSTLLVHARRSQILPEEHRAKVFGTKTPQSVPTFLVDGRVAGTWRYENGRVELSPFAPLARADRRGVEAEAKRLAALHA